MNPFTHLRIYGFCYLLMLLLSSISSGLFAQQELISSVAADALPDNFNHEEVYRLDTMFGALSVEIIQVYSPHLLSEGETVLHDTETLTPISVEAESSTEYRWRAINAENSLDVTVLRSGLGFAGTVLDHESDKLYRFFPVDETFLSC